MLFVSLFTAWPHNSKAAPERAQKILLSGNLTQPSRHSPQWICYEFLMKKKRLYGIHDPHQDLKIISIEQNTGQIRISLQQLLFDTPVWGAMLSVEMDKEGVIHRVYGTFYPGLEKKLFNLPMHSAISAEKAVAIAKSSLPADQPVIGRPEASLYYLAARPGCPLVYVVTFTVDTLQSESRAVFVHSLTKRVIGDPSQLTRW
jgi:Zn-dependent metalloprotease